MAKTDKPLTRDALVSMEVIDAAGQLVGKVTDVAFEVGKSGISLAVETKKGESKTIEWNAVQAASDYILLKPEMQSTVMQAQPQQQMQPQTQTVQAPTKQKGPPICPTCGKPLTWIPQYKRWYCYNDKKYV